MTKQHKIEELKQFAQTLKENGFTVLVSAKNPFAWIHIYNDGKFGYIQPSYFSGFDFSTTHKPCKECGTGFSKMQMSELTIENAKKTLNNNNNEFNSYHKYVKHYTSVEEFIKLSWGDYYIL